MLTRNLGRSGISVSTHGLGCMGLSEFYGEPTQVSEAVALLHRAVDLGVTHFDTAEMYGQGRNEELLGRAFAGRWRDVVVATKFGPQRDPATGAFVGVDGSPANVRASCVKLGISLVAYSPLGRGMLTGRYASTHDLPASEKDFRAGMQPRFQPGNVEANLKLVEAIKAIAARRQCAAAQVALAWVLGRGDHVVAIPGTTKIAHLESNLGALECPLTEEDRAVLDALADQVRGERYAPEGMSAVNR